MKSWRKPKPFVCSLCSNDFAKESQLKRHLKDKHNVVKDKEEHHAKECTAEISNT